jgi:cytochrome c oxidase subunit 2
MRTSTASRRWPHLPRGLLLALTLVVLAACAGESYPQSTLHPKGDFAVLVDHVFRTTVWWATIIFVGVEGALLYAIFRFRGKDGDPEPKQIHGNTLIEIIWTVIPAAVLAIVAVPTVKTIFETARIPESSPDGQAPLKVEVIGHQWWWEFRYPDLGIVTANELHVPLGRTVDLRMKTVDVLHSFWIPQFAGKRDVFPNRETRLWFTAADTGAFPGACAEFCGLQHARMDFYVMVTSPDRFTSWVAVRQADSAAFAMRPLPAPTPDSVAADSGAVTVAALDPQVAAGRQLTLTKGCVGCHSFGSAGAMTTLQGPNLGGIGTRHMIAAGWLLNTDENLTAWIKDPGALKHGVAMAGKYQVTDAEAAAIAAYLRTRQ